jgi:hypothetical protein
MDRKQFLGTLFVLPVGVFLVHCSSDSGSKSTASAGTGGAADTGSGGGDAGGADPNAPAAAPTQSQGMDVYTSSTVGNHHHTFTFDDSDIATPPADGVSGDSSTDSMHSHTVAISSDQLAMVAAGDSVEVTSGVAGSHTHVFTFVKIA